VTESEKDGTFSAVFFGLLSSGGGHKGPTLFLFHWPSSDAAAGFSPRAKPGANGHIAYKTRFPGEIVRIFKAHGFIWGGKWYHYDRCALISGRTYRGDEVSGQQIISKTVTNVVSQTQPTYPTPIVMLLAQRG